MDIDTEPFNVDTATTTDTTTQPRKYPPWNYCRTCTLTFQFPAGDTGDTDTGNDSGDRTGNGDGCPGCCSLDYLDIQTANDTPDFWGKVMKP